MSLNRIFRLTAIFAFSIAFIIIVLLVFEDGSECREGGDPQKEWKLYRMVRPSRLATAMIDPERKILLDINYSNNSFVMESQSGLASKKWASKWMIWLQDYLQALSFLM